MWRVKLTRPISVSCLIIYTTPQYYDFKALNNTKQLASSNSKNPPHIRYYRPSVISNVSIGNNKLSHTWLAQTTSNKASSSLPLEMYLKLSISPPELVCFWKKISRTSSISSSSFPPLMLSSRTVLSGAPQKACGEEETKVS